MSVKLKLMYNKKTVKLIYNKRQCSFLEEHNSFYSCLFGFRPNDSTNIELLEMTEQIKKACDKGLFACWVYLDLKDVLTQ